jgi:microcystin-dependent protein
MEPMIAQIMMFGGNFAPRGWAFCDGQLLDISQNQALFAILGTTYGGDGRTSFALPDLRGRTPIAPGTGQGLPTYKSGAKGGSQTTTLTVQDMPSHTHLATVTQSASGAANGKIKSGGAGTSNDPTGKFIGQPGNIGPSAIKPYTDAATGDMAAGSVSVDMSDIPAPTVTNLNTGGSQPHNNMQPFLAINYIIALVGFFPPRS